LPLGEHIGPLRDPGLGTGVKWRALLRWLVTVLGLCLLVVEQVFVCLCDAFSRPHQPPAVRYFPRPSPTFTPKVAGDVAAVGDTEPDVEPSDDVC